jgi:hypothetical protein
MRADEFPMDMIDHIGGWKSSDAIGVRYGRGHDIESLRTYLLELSKLRK